MKIQVISLENSDERRESIKRQFEALETEFEFFDAITPKQTHKHISDYNENEFAVNCGRPAREAEIACFASHLVLWRQCIDEGVPYLILEDDAKIDDRFLSGIVVASDQIRKLGFIRMSLPEPSTSMVMWKRGPFNVHFCRRVPLQTLGYAISPRAAERLVRRCNTVAEPVDKYLQRYWRHKQPIFAIEPAVVRYTDHAAVSDIGARSTPRPTALVRLRRAGRKTHNSIARTVFSAHFLIGATLQRSWRAREDGLAALGASALFERLGSNLRPPGS